MIGVYIGVILLISSIIADEEDDELYPLDPLDPLEEDFHYDPLFQLANMKSGSDYQERNVSQNVNKKEPDYKRLSPSLSSLQYNLNHSQNVKEMKELHILRYFMKKQKIEVCIVPARIQHNLITIETKLTKDLPFLKLGLQHNI